MKQKHKVLQINVLSVLLLVFFSSCKNNMRHLIAGENYKIWDLHDTTPDGKPYIVGCYYCTAKGHCAYFMYGKEDQRLDIHKNSDYKYPRTWDIIDNHTIKFAGRTCTILKLDRETLDLYCPELSEQHRLLTISPNQTIPYGYVEGDN